MKKIYILYILFLISIQTFVAQGRLEYDTDSKWFWGLNFGTTWQTTDVRNKNDFGLGLTLGKSFNYNYGKKISFDIRGRYLYGEWYGQDRDTTGILKGLPPVLAQGNTNYQDSMSFSVLNFKTYVHRLSLELVIHANGIRERSNWDPYIFGGIGLTWYKSMGNQLYTNDSLGVQDQLYAYNQLANFGKNTIKGIQDKSYETYLNGNANGNYKVGFMPSLGFGLGYQVSKRFSIGLEHKTTFTLVDDFDGYQHAAGKYKNDWYHYTSFYLRFQVRSHRYVEPVNTVEKVPEYTQPTVDRTPPQVDFTQPASSGTRVASALYVIKASVRYVEDPSKVLFRQNGNTISAFNFNPQTDRFEANVVLVPGQNVFELTGTNPYGTDSETTVIFYEVRNPIPPVVDIQNPAANPTTVYTPSFNFVGSVLNVTGRNKVTFTFNNQNITNFTYDVNSGKVTASLNLNVGINTVRLYGVNDYGSDEESTTIIYNPRQVEQLPQVYFVNPNSNPYSVSTANFTIDADVLHVSSKQNVTFKQNGVVNTNFTFNASTNDFQSSVVLVPGQNVFEIIGTNTAGSAQATTIIIYERTAPKPPVVTITNPYVNPLQTENEWLNFTATVLNVSAKSQIEVILNGTSFTNFSFNSATKVLNATMQLIQGTNTISVRGTNSDGTDFKQTVVVFRKPISALPPVVQFITPNSNPFTSSVATFNVLASVLNVDNSAGISVLVNGVSTTNFSFNTATKQVSFPLNLIVGSNVIVITGTNAVGTDSKTQTIIYKREATVTPPVVSFIDPGSNPMTVYNPNYSLKARVENVTSAADITLRINGNLSSNFSFSPSSQLMTFNSNLLVGANIFEIIGRNSAGQDQASTTLVLRQANPVNPPVVTITNPATNGNTVSASTAPIQATVLNVDSQNDILVQVNGSNFTGFSYDQNSKQVIFTASLNPGTNTIYVRGTNTVGQASDTRTIIFQREAQQAAPFVTFINPNASGTTVNSPGYTMRAKILNIQSKTQAQVEMNGIVINPSLYSFNPSSLEITYNCSLNEGNNTFTVSGTNAGGSHSASTTISYVKAVVPCDKPEIRIVELNGSTAVLTEAQFPLTATYKYITAPSQVKVYLNGQAVTNFNMALETQSLNHTFTLQEGQNTIEIVVTNPCGSSSTSKIVTYRAPKAPCNSPSVTLLSPNANISVDQVSYIVQAGVQGVSQASEVSLFVNGQLKTIVFDAARNSISAQVDLVLGANEIKIQVSNDCGSAQAMHTIQRSKCKAPVIALVSASVANNQSTTNQAATISVSITDIEESSQITATQNGDAINFVYNPQTHLLTLDRSLIIGSNAFEIKAENSCGNVVFKHLIKRKLELKLAAPTIQITNPSSTPYNTDEAAMNVQVKTSNATSSDQISITVNGNPVNFSFDALRQIASFNYTWNDGINVISATVITLGGSAQDAKIVKYTRKVVLQAPKIYITSPSACPATLNVGTSTISGYVTNISNVNQVTFTFNNRPVTNVTPTIRNGNLYFTISLSMGAGNNPMNLQINANNGGGSDSKSCTYSVAQTAPVVKPVRKPTTVKPPTETTPTNTEPTIITPTRKPTKVVVPTERPRP